MRTIGRLLDRPEGSFFLFGPRGTGKSLLTRIRYPDAVRIDFLDPGVERVYASRPEQLYGVTSAHPGKTIVLDEVQKVPAVLSVVHSEMERDKTLQFVLTGSSARKLKREGADMLAGRAVVRTLHPFTAAELGSRFDLEAALHLGTVPLVVMSGDPSDVLRTYVGNYIREEVQMERLIRRVDAFHRFLEVLSYSHGALLNSSGIARECFTSRYTVEEFISVTEDLLLSYRVPVFSRRAKRQVVAHQKFYFFDAGVFRSLRPTGPMDRVAEIDGAALEGLVGQHLRAWIAYRNSKDALHFWGTRYFEVDFVIYGESGFWGIEVKNSVRVRPEDLRSLRAFGDEYPEASLLLLYRGREQLRMEGVLCLPVDEFLQGLVPTELLPAV
jgi:uncharacterized protein